MTATRPRRPSRPLLGDRGSITVELVIVTPVAIALLCLVALVGRTTNARSQVDEAARDAARAASIARDPSDAQTVAQQSASTALADGGYHCDTTNVAVDVSSFGPGGQVAVTVTCNVSLSDLGLIGLSGTRAFTARAVSVVDLYRATTP